MGKNEYQRLVEDNIGLVHTCCARLKGRGIEYDDLFQAGCVGLCKAAERFDPTLGFCFSTYAVPVILGEIRQLFRSGGAVKISRSMQEKAMEAGRIREQLKNELLREPTVSEIAQKMGLETAETAQALAAGHPVLSLTLGDEQETSDIPVESEEHAICDRTALQQMLSGLNAGDRKILYYRYYCEKTQSETGCELNMSQVQVSRREKKILAILRSGLV